MLLCVFWFRITKQIHLSFRLYDVDKILAILLRQFFFIKQLIKHKSREFQFIRHCLQIIK